MLRTVGDVSDDPRYVVVDGRRWRATDPGVPEQLRTELVAELMSARRAFTGAEVVGGARGRVQDAKVALGERGEPWWEAASPEGRAERLAAAMRTLLRHRARPRRSAPATRPGSSPGIASARRWTTRAAWPGSCARRGSCEQPRKARTSTPLPSADRSASVEARSGMPSRPASAMREGRALSHPRGSERSSAWPRPLCRNAVA